MTSTSLLPSSSLSRTVKWLEVLRFKANIFPCRIILLRNSQILSVTNSNTTSSASALSPWELWMAWGSTWCLVSSWMLAMGSSSKPHRLISSKMIERPSRISIASSRSYWIKFLAESRPPPVACKPTQSWISPKCISRCIRPRHRKSQQLRGTFLPSSHSKTTRRLNSS